MDNSIGQSAHGGRSVVRISLMAIGCILLVSGFWWRPAWILVGCMVSFLGTLTIQLSVGFFAVLSHGKRRILWGQLLASFSRLTFEGFVIWFVVVVFPPVVAAITISWALLVASQKILSRNKNWSARRIGIAAAESTFASIVGFASLYWVYGIRNSDGTHFDLILSIYFSVVTWTTLGYGDFYPEPQVRLVAAIEALSAYCFMGVFLSQLVSAKSSEKSDNT
jgi:hypothetical protein